MCPRRAQSPHSFVQLVSVVGSARTVQATVFAFKSFALPLNPNFTGFFVFLDFLKENHISGFVFLFKRGTFIISSKSSYVAENYIRFKKSKVTSPSSPTGLTFLSCLNKRLLGRQWLRPQDCFHCRHLSHTSDCLSQGSADYGCRPHPAGQWFFMSCEQRLVLRVFKGC